MKTIEIKIQKVTEDFNDLPLPSYSTEGSSGLDLRAAVESEFILKKNSFALIPTNIRVEIPLGYEIQIRPRSGLAAKNGIGVLNSPGTIDSDYRGEIKIILFNFSNEDFIIKRGEKIGVRLRDLNAPLLAQFKGIERFPINSDWRIEAEFIPYNPPKKLLIPTVIGTIEEELSPGAVKFVKDGKDYKFDLQDAGKQYFAVFADLTSGKETYGGGRFLYIDKPDSTGKFFVDFNKTYNPPCVFTKYATCPLPTKDNYLKLEITAGEKNFGEGH